MKIGIVCYPSVGGSGILATELGHELALKGHEVHFITYDIPFKLHLEKKNIFFHEVEISHYDLFKYPDYALALAVKIAQVVRDYRLDILHVHYAFPHATSAFLANQLLENQKIKVVTTLHGTDITLVGREPSYFQIIKFSIEKSNGITVVSKSLKDQMCCQFSIRDNVEVIYNFFCPKQDLIGKKPLRDLFVTKKQKLLVHSSNYRSVKRPADVAHIFKAVRKEIDSKLLLLGSGDGIEEIHSLVVEMNFEKDIFILGKNREIDSYVASADLFLLPSALESFGLAALEAMSYGLPVVASEVGGIPELVLHGKTGYLAPMGDVQKMADYAIELLSNEEKYQAFSQASSERAFTEFSAKKIVPQYEAYYQKILNR
jgi:N-acetyl-alpha-D-glucosaminyl L-malate synthase BshA